MNLMLGEDLLVLPVAGKDKHGGEGGEGGRQKYTQLWTRGLGRLSVGMDSVMLCIWVSP